MINYPVWAPSEEPYVTKGHAIFMRHSFPTNFDTAIELASYEDYIKLRSSIEDVCIQSNTYQRGELLKLIQGNIDDLLLKLKGTIL